MQILTQKVWGGTWKLHCVKIPRWSPCCSVHTLRSKTLELLGHTVHISSTFIDSSNWTNFTLKEMKVFYSPSSPVLDLETFCLWPIWKHETIIKSYFPDYVTMIIFSYWLFKLFLFMYFTRFSKAAVLSVALGHWGPSFSNFLSHEAWFSLYSLTKI